MTSKVRSFLVTPKAVAIVASLGVASFLTGFALAAGSALAACSDTAGASPDGGGTSADGGPGTSPEGGPDFSSGSELAVTVPATGRAFVSLGSAKAVTVEGDGKTSTAWDLAFEGYDVFTNGGVSGSGKATAFGPFDDIVFLGDVAPEPPFLFEDKAGGAFLNWYSYEGAPTHALWSRYHVVVVKDGDRYFKVQVLGYYGERSGAPVAALYKVRWAELTATGVGPTQEASALDGTAGGPNGADDAPSECLDLGTGARALLTPAASRASSAWHLCFRRQTISVNGELGGPRGVGAADLDADKLANETVAIVNKRTDDSERPRFEAVTRAQVERLDYRGDRVVSAFSGLWITRQPDGTAISRPAAWLVVGADGKSKYLVGFGAFDGATPQGPGTVHLYVKPVQ